MKLSIFPKINFHPTPEQKPDLSKLSSKPHYPEIREFNSEEELFDLVTNFGWSPSIFSGHRKNANFSFCDVLALDIDNGMRLEEAELICKNNKLSALISPSPSFTPEHHKFRIILPLVRRISTPEEFEATWLKLAEVFPSIDDQCKDMARFFFPCRPDMDNTVWVEGDFLQPVTPQKKSVDKKFRREYNLVTTEGLESKDALTFLYGTLPEKVSEAVSHFLENAHTGLEGEWINSLNACVFTLASQGIPHERIWEAIESVAPNSLDSKDTYQIERALRDGDEAYEEKLLEEDTKTITRRRLR